MATKTDNFNRANQTGLGSSSEGWSWTSVRATEPNIVSNQAVSQATGVLSSVRAESDLDSTDHYCQLDLVTSQANGHFGPAARFAAAAETFYRVIYYPVDGKQYLSKLVTGTETHLTSIASSDNGTLKVECNGTAIKGYRSGVEVTSVTDSSITTGTRCGMGGLDNSVVVDNWQAADLAAAAAVQIMFTASSLDGVGSYGRFRGNRPS